MNEARPVVAVSIGDPAGIGPEIALRALRAPGLAARLLLVGDRSVLARDAAGTGVEVPPRVRSPEEMTDRGLEAGLLEPGTPLAAPPARGVVDARAGEASFRWVCEGAALARAGRVAALVTGPIHKEAWAAAGVPFPGHTEALADLDGAPRVLMVMEGGPLRVVLATVHVALARVPGLLDPRRLVEDLVLLAREGGRLLGPDRPRIAVAGLNPHAGEGGLFGTEDRDVIAPAVAAARERGVDAYGPLPADACIPAAAHGDFDFAFAMYHDQGLVAVKALAPRQAVNLTLGLSFVRTSVDHGTAFDVAGRGVARPSSLVVAIHRAVAMARRRSEVRSGLGNPGSEPDAARDSTQAVPPPT